MTESALEPRLHTVGVVDGKLPPGIYSARDSEAMYTFTDSAKVKQGAYRIENEGMTLEGSGLDPKVQEFRREELRKAKIKLRPFLETEYGLAMVQFRKLDAERDGKLTHNEFKEVIGNFHLGLTPAQLTEVIRTSDPEQSQMIDYGEFCERFGSVKAKMQMHGAKKKSTPKLKKAPPSIPTDESKGKAAEKLIPEIICIVGFLLCPVWCLGWIWCNSKWPASRWRARFSVTMSVVVGIVGLILIVVLYVIPEASVEYAQQCPQITGTLFALRCTGNNARIERFNDYDSQFRMKVAMYKLYEQAIADRSRSVEDAIILDEMIPLQPDQTTNTPRMQLIGRMITTDTDAAEGLGSAIRFWVQNSGELTQSLLEEGIPFQLVELDVIRPVISRTVTISTPVVFEQSKLNVVTGSQEWQSTRSTPALLQNSPLTQSIFDDNNPEAQKHLDPALRTCWSTVVYPLPADPCLENPDISCSEKAADGVTERQDRVLQIEVYTNTTEDVLQVWIRQNDGELGVVSEAPMPNWLASDDDSIRALATRDLSHPVCAELDGNIESCPWKYVANIAKGPFRTSYWIGVVGRIPEARYIPFEVRTRHRNFNPFKEVSNPFAVFVQEAEVGGAQRLAPVSGFALSLLLALATAACQHHGLF